MNNNISITLPVPFMTLPKFAEVSGLSYETCRTMVKDGRLPIRKKERKMEKVLVNIVALTQEAAKS